jgi:hypothetical protein
MALRAVVVASLGSGVILGLLLLNLHDVEGVAIVGWLISFPILLVGDYLYQMTRTRRVMRRAIAEALNGERPPFCFACGYNLQGCTGEKCPECGIIVAIDRVQAHRQ